MSTLAPRDDDLGDDLRHLRRLAHCLASDAALADDATQDAMVVAMTQRPPALVSVRAWLGAVLRHRILRLRRREERRRDVEGTAARAEAQPAADEVVATAALHRQLATDVEGLPEPYRAAIVLRFLHDLPAQEVARRTQVPLETARTRIKRGLALLRQRLDGSYGGRAGWTGLLVFANSPPLAAASLLMSLKPIAFAGAALAALCVFFALRASWSPPAAAPEEPAPAATLANEVPAGTGAPAVVARVEVPAPAAPVEKRRGPETLWGRVVAGEEARPVSGAFVELVHRDADEFGNLDLEYGEQLAKLGEAATDAEGAFAFAVTRARLHRVHVRAAGFAPRVVEGCAGGAELVVTLTRGAAVRGVVRSAGKPVADAAVEVSARGGHRLAGTTTAADGTFAVDDLAAVPVYVQVGSPRHVEAWREATLAAGETHTVDVELASGRTVRGQVTDAATQQPIAGAEVGHGWTFSCSVRTDADGRFTLPGVAATSAMMHVRAAGYAAAVRELPSDVEAPVADVALARGATVRGRLLDGQGKPIGQGYIVAAAHHHFASYVHTDWRRGELTSDGRFVVTGLRGACQLMARSPGCGTRFYDLPAPLRDGEAIDLGDVTLLPPSGLEGRVVDDAGTALGGVDVTMAGGNVDRATALAHLRAQPKLGAGAPPRDIHHFKPTSRRTAADGTFRFGGLAGGCYELQVHVRGRTTSAGPFEVRDGEVREGIEVVASRGASIAGRVALPPELPAGEVRKLTLIAYDNALSDHQSVRVAADGTFAIAGLKATKYVVSALECPAGFALSPAFDVAAGSTDVQLRLLPASTIEGRVVDAAGQPVRARLFAKDARENPPLSKNHETDAEGRFRLFVPPDFVGVVHAQHLDTFFIQGKADQVAAGARDLVLQIGPPRLR